MTASSRRNDSISAAVSLLLYALEAALLLVALTMYKRAGRPLPEFVGTPAGHMMLLGLCATVGLGLLTIGALFNPSRRRQFLPTLALNLGVLIVLFAVAEMVIRSLVSQTSAGPAFGDTILLPRSWESESARNREILRQATLRRSYLVPDPDLGWAIRPYARNRDYNLEFELEYLRRARSSSHADELAGAGPRVSATDDSVYLSSVEGLRSPRAGIALAALPHRHRIALVGDSFTFGLEVRYEETWGHRLEAALGGDYQVLNFGVDGYGVDQAYLRYRRDAAKWHPEIVVLGVVSDDLHRTMCVYGFLCFPGSQIPFSKPRFVLAGDSLRLLHQPAVAPDSIFSMHSIGELPLIEYDHDYDPYEWDWHSYDMSYAIRYLLSRYRRWSVRRAAVSDSALEAVNAALFRAFVRDVRANGATPVVLFFPSRSELSPTWHGPLVGRDVLRKSGIPFLDMTPCITRLPAAERYVVLHLSPAANAAVATCLREERPDLFGSAALH